MIINNTPNQQDQNNPDYSQQPVGRSSQSGTGYTNIDQLLNANQGAGQQMGQRVGQGISNLGSNVTNAANQDYSKFQTQANNALNPYTGSTGYFNRANALVAPTQSTGESDTDYQKALSDYYKNTSGLNSNDLSTLGQNVANASYKGPTGLANAPNLQYQANQVSQIQNVGANPAGQQALLGAYLGRGNYTQGQSALDQALLGGSGQKAIQSGVSKLSGLPQSITNMINQAQNQANAYSGGIGNEAKAIQTNVNATENGPTTGTNPGGLLTQGQTNTANLNKQIDTIQQILASGGTAPNGGYTPEEKALLKQVPSLLQQYGLNSEDLATAYNKQANAGQGLGTINSGVDPAMLYGLSQALQKQNATNYTFGNQYDVNGGSFNGGSNTQQGTAANLASFLQNPQISTALQNNTGVTNMQGILNQSNFQNDVGTVATGSQQNNSDALAKLQAAQAQQLNNYQLTQGGNPGGHWEGNSSEYTPGLANRGVSGAAQWVDPMTGLTMGSNPVGATNPITQTVGQYADQILNDYNAYNPLIQGVQGSGSTLQDLLNKTFGPAPVTGPGPQRRPNS